MMALLDYISWDFVIHKNLNKFYQNIHVKFYKAVKQNIVQFLRKEKLRKNYVVRIGLPILSLGFVKFKHFHISLKN